MIRIDCVLISFDADHKAENGSQYFPYFYLVIHHGHLGCFCGLLINGKFPFWPPETGTLVHTLFHTYLISFYHSFFLLSYSLSIFINIFIYLLLSALFLLLLSIFLLSSYGISFHFPPQSSLPSLFSSHSSFPSSFHLIHLFFSVFFHLQP